MKKETQRLKKLQLHREVLRDLDLAAAAGGTLTGHTDITFRYTNCVTVCNTTV